MSRTSENRWAVNFGESVPFVGIGEISRMHLEPHHFLANRSVGTKFGKTPWNDRESNLATIARDNTPIAILSVEGDYKANIDELHGKLHSVSLDGPTFGYGLYTIDIVPTMTPTEIASAIDKENYILQFNGNPTIFSIVPLEVKYNMITEGSLNEVPAIVGDRLLMDGRLSRINNGVVNVPAGQVTDLGPLLNVVINRHKSSDKEKEAYMVTRRLTLSIRMLSYGG